MVDYTKDVMRDETWRRWKGGTKLAEDLRNFYTNPRVFARLAAQGNPMGPSSAVAAGASDWKKEAREGWLRHMLGMGPGRNPGGRFGLSPSGKQMLFNKLSGSTPGEDRERAAARQSGATLPGR